MALIKKNFIEVVAVEIDGKITNDKRTIYGLIEFGNKKPRLIRREIFQFMEAADLWKEKKLTKLPTLYKFTREQWQEARDMGIAHG